MLKNVAGQKWIVFAFNRTNNDPKTGDAANITANLRIDGGAANAVDDTNPTELEDGYYVFDITQAESNGDVILISPESSTENIQVIGVPGVERPTGVTGGGAYTGTLTVDDGSTGLQGAVVNARRGGVLKASGTTDANGQITNWVFGAYTYDLAVRLDDYEPETDTLAVSADAWTKTISLTLLPSITPPPNASTTTGVMTVYDEEGSVESGVSVTVQITEGPGTDGIGYDSAEWTETSSALGIVEFAGIILGARYKIWRGDSKANAQTFTAPSSGDSFNLAEVIGRE
jgi:hypothetical protein